MFARQDRAKTLLTLLVTLMKIPPYFIQRAGNFGWFWSITEAGRFHLYGKLLSESYREEFDQWYLPQARLHILS